MTTRSARPWKARATAALVGLLAVTTGAASAQAQQTASTTDPESASGRGGRLSWPERTLRSMTLEQKVGQLFVVDVWGTSADETHPGNQRKYGVDTPADVVREYNVGGVIYFNHGGTDNIETPRQVARLSNGLQRAALNSGPGVPLVVAVDQEGGRVTRIAEHVTEYPSAMALGASRDVDGARTAAAISATELRAMGITQDFAPVADVNSNPLNPVIGSRSFSSDADLAGQFVAAQVDGYENSGPAPRRVSAAAKHFPGHGDAKDDSHVGLPVIDRSEQDWRTHDLPPFRKAVEADIDVIMTAHISVPSLDASGDPATLSRPIMTGLLREELGYDGVVVTDSLGMAGVRKKYSDAEIPVRALEAGVDQMLMPPDLDAAIGGVLAAVRSGRLTEERIDTSVLRVLRMKHERGIVERPIVPVHRVDDVVGTEENRETVQRLTDRSTTVLSDDAGLLPLEGEVGKVLVTGWNRPTYPGYAAEPVEALAEALTRRTEAEIEAISTGAAPDQATIDHVVGAAGTADVVIVLTNGLRGSEAQRQLVERLTSTDTPVIAVAVQEPYDPGHVEVPTWIATYDWRDVTMNSLAKVIVGERSPEGRLPVAVPDGPDPTQILYPFGHGLTFLAPTRRQEDTP
ncbi:glycoside hydrolase family 3 protein [Saccharomonospora xinjiangensis]|uniref:beta-N-acetylhexosaminidase n=1 Tax=Saccharomonospora xinjiangensis XJ-54 TaxID=882086 RepID=I0V3L4_9PSEU|nr:glycoside hydrolase family 3 N-terminal domain-containing protein [Saccharomonospora xinjiangensis]EID54717.1 beta-glucosidase-like glycosyl hydrolase [Saccharomonospora xinjiangensis XJ-54]